MESFLDVEMVAEHYRRIMVIGRPGTGKSTLARTLAEHKSKTNRRCAFLSADIGQPSIGIPACVGLSTSPHLDEVAAYWFIGSFSPSRHTLPLVVGVLQLIRYALKLGIDHFVIDSSGLIDRRIGRVLTLHLIEAVDPDLVIGLEHRDELNMIGSLITNGRRALCRRAPHPLAHNRSQTKRRQARESMLERYFEMARTMYIPRSIVVNDELIIGGELHLCVTQSDDFRFIVGLLNGEGYCLGLGLARCESPSEWHLETPVTCTEFVKLIQASSIIVGRGEGYRDLGQERTTA